MSEPNRANDESTIMAWADDYLATNNEPCWFDHHGGCQAHGYLSLEPGEHCPEGAALLAHRRLAEGHYPAGRAVQDDGLDVERLRERLTAALIEAEADDQLGPEYSPDALAWYLSTRLAASPLNASGDER